MEMMSQNKYEQLYTDIVHRIYMDLRDSLGINDTIYFLNNSKKNISYKILDAHVGAINVEPADNRIKKNDITAVFGLGYPKWNRNKVTVTVSLIGASYRSGSLRYTVSGWSVFTYVYDKRTKKYKYLKDKTYGI